MFENFDATIRLCLIAGSVLTMGFVLYRIRKAQILIEDSIFWILLSACLTIISIFPQIPIIISNMLGFLAPINFIFLLIIFILLAKLFLNSVKISQLDTKIKALTQQIAINQNDIENNK